MRSRVTIILRLLIAFVSSTVMAVPFTTIEKGHYSGIEDGITEAYSNNQDFERFWGQHVSIISPTPNVPIVDFTSQMVIVVNIGTKSSGGYAVEITSVEEDENLVVNFMTSSPSPGSINTMALTQPYHIIQLKNSDKKVKFMGSEEDNSKATETTLPRFIISLKKGIDRASARAKIETLPSVQHVEGMTAISIGTVDFHSGSISVEDARELLRGIDEIKSFEEEYSY